MLRCAEFSFFRPCSLGKVLTASCLALVVVVSGDTAADAPV